MDADFERLKKAYQRAGRDLAAEVINQDPYAALSALCQGGLHSYPVQVEPGRNRTEVEVPPFYTFLYSYRTLVAVIARHQGRHLRVCEERVTSRTTRGHVNQFRGQRSFASEGEITAEQIDRLAQVIPCVLPEELLGQIEA